MPIALSADGLVLSDNTGEAIANIASLLGIKRDCPEQTLTSFIRELLRDWGIGTPHDNELMASASESFAGTLNSKQGIRRQDQYFRRNADIFAAICKSRVTRAMNKDVEEPTDWP